MPKRVRLSPECVERLRTWIEIKCPCALEDRELLPGLWVIVEDEVADAILKARARIAAAHDNPNLN